MTPDPESLLPLSPAVFHILLALADQERHGYAIMQEVLAQTNGKLRFGPGTLYGSIKRMLAASLIEETDERPDPALDDERRRYYRMTDFGRQVANAEAQRLAQLMRLASFNRLLSGGKLMNRLQRLSEHAYRALLYLYPAEHRREYGDLMAQTFRDLNRAAYARSGRRGITALWLRTLADALVSAGIEHFSLFRRRLTMSKRSLFVWLLTALFAVFTGYVNVHNNEVQAPMACILLFSFILGLLQRKTAWLRAIVIGLSIPASYFVSFAISVKPVDPPHLPITTAVLVIPALVACYAGVVVGLGIAPLQRRTS